MAERLEVQDPDAPASNPPSLPLSGEVSLLIALVLSLSLARYLHTMVKLWMESPFIDFAHYYAYATVVAHGLNPFDPAAVAQMDGLLGFRRAGSPANYPPLFYLLMRPWTAISFPSAAAGWLLASHAFLLGSLLCCRRRFRSASALRIAMVTFVALNYQPLIEDLALGQVNTLLLLLATLAWWGMQTGHPWVAAMGVAIAPFVKPQYSLLLLLLWWTGHRRVLARSLLIVGLAGTAGLVFLGPAHHWAYLRHLLSLSDAFYIRAANLAPRGAFLRLFGLSAAGSIIANGLAALLAVALLILAGRNIPRSAAPPSPAGDWSWSLALVGIPLISPFAEEHHLVILLLPLALLLLDESGGMASVGEQALLMLCLVLLATPYSLDRFSIFHQGLPSLLANGKLLGVGTLAWILIRRLRTLRGSTRESAP
jgi:hypothetical protein